jgi:beta-glucosidase
VVVRADGDEPEVTVTLTVTNTGERAGQETVQLYVSDPQSSVYRPEQELRAFAKVALDPGASTPVTFTLGARAFAFWHGGAARWVVEGGEFGVRVGASSRDIRLTGTVTLRGQDVRTPLTAESTADAWLDHPQAGPWLRERLAGMFEAMLFDPQNGQMMRAVPLQRLSRFPGFPVSEQDVDAAVARYAQ